MSTTIYGLEWVREAQGWDELAQALQQVAFERPKAKRGDCDEALKERAKGLREACKKQLQRARKKLKKYF